MRLAAALLFLYMSASAGPLPPDFQRLDRTKKLTVALHSEDSPPFFFADEKGELQGIDVELARLIAAKLKVQVSFKRTAKEFHEVVDQVADGSADVAIAALYPSLARMKAVTFTQPYLEIPAVVVVNRAQAARLGVRTGEMRSLDVPAAKVGYLNSTVLTEAVPNFLPNAQLKVYEDRSALVRDLRGGLLTAVFTDEVEVAKWRKLIPDFSLYLSTLKLQTPTFSACIAVNWKDQHLAYWLNEFIRQSRGNGAIEAIVRRHWKKP